jgi:hypothetical protein
MEFFMLIKVLLGCEECTAGSTLEELMNRIDMATAVM